MVILQERPVAEHCSAALALGSRLLSGTATTPLGLDGFLHELAETFGADGAGCVEPGGRTRRQRTASGEPALPWMEEPILLTQAAESLTALVFSRGEQHYLCGAAGADRVLWIESARATAWNQEETGALALVGQALGRRLALEDAGWPGHAGQQRLEDAVLVARKLAHVYSNVLTSVLGFVEMSLAQVPAHSTLKRYLDVAFRGVQQGVGLTQRLQLLGCKATLSSQGAMMLPILARQVGRRTTPERKVEETLDVPNDLPPVALSSEQVTAILDALLDNAHEALERGGRVSVVARVVVPGAEEVREAWGRMSPGTFVRLDVSDTGPGMSPEKRARLFQQPLLTTKPRHHGLGLTIVHSILSSQQGGLQLLDNPGEGLTVRVFLPVFRAGGFASTGERRGQS